MAVSTPTGMEKSFLEVAGSTLQLFIAASQVRVLLELWMFLPHCISVLSASDLRPIFEGIALKQTWSVTLGHNSKSCTIVSYWFLGKNWWNTMQVFLVPEADFALNRLDYLGSYMERNSKQRGSIHHNPKHPPSCTYQDYSLPSLPLPFQRPSIKTCILGVSVGASAY